MGLILLRHPRVDAPGLCYGRFDPPLAPGHEDAVVRAALQCPPAERLLTSPAPRCQGLAAELGAALGLSPEPDPRLQELDFGAWEGRAWAELPRVETDPWAEDPEHRAPPGGETFAQLRARVRAALAGHTRTVVVTHAGPIRAARILAGEQDFATAFATPVPYATPVFLPVLTD